MFKKDPLQIISFQTYGSSNHLYARGRAIEDESIDLEHKGVFKLLLNAWKRFETDEIKNTELRVKIGNDKFFYTTTDNKGYFLLDEKIDDISSYANEEGWVKLEFSFKLEQLSRTIKSDNRFPGEMLIPSQKASFGVISDIDDTILHTGISSILKWRVLINTFLVSSGKRMPLEGAPEFYHLLHQGKNGHEANPIFYVSHSPWNLYRYLEYFLKKNNFPKGPIILRNFPRPFSRKNKGEKPQKQKEILNLLKAYPKMNFILIGDIGEHDPDIYLEIAEAYPERISAIYLRSVNHKKKIFRVKSLYNQYKTTPVLLVENTDQAIVHAKKHHFIK
ncbi:phosphatidate phosphatase APP1 [Mariniflexile fucanivorans]|uniref:Phosphatidate phosphatase APP1 n=1 Tax=Mariniflexile fucanivorans TaxID=264023 RepID=A0A4R1RIC4_9FLAO|nr:phosphatase domain-containing protein [Mariniflexile fucanivorans]TCL65520.1 phosphatidate phosphatase APP1 [Mariniflexile fucanivorans]